MSQSDEDKKLIEGLLELRTGDPARAAEILRRRAPTIELALALAASGDEQGALEIIEKCSSGQLRGDLRRYECQLRELAKILDRDVEHLKLATPFLERWIRRPLEPAKTD